MYNHMRMRGVCNNIKILCMRDIMRARRLKLYAVTTVRRMQLLALFGICAAYCGVRRTIERG